MLIFYIMPFFLDSFLETGQNTGTILSFFITVNIFRNVIQTQISFMHGIIYFYVTNHPTFDDSS